VASVSRKACIRKNTRDAKLFSQSFRFDNNQSAADTLATGEGHITVLNFRQHIWFNAER